MKNSKEEIAQACQQENAMQPSDRDAVSVVRVAAKRAREQRHFTLNANAACATPSQSGMHVVFSMTPNSASATVMAIGIHSREFQKPRPRNHPGIRGKSLFGRQIAYEFY